MVPERLTARTGLGGVAEEPGRQPSYRGAVNDPRDAAPDAHWFQPVTRFLGADYLRHAFTKGTEQEVDFLWDALHLQAGSRVLDVGCGPGRHALALARRGATVTGIDISEEFIALARAAAAAEDVPCDFRVADARRLAFDRQFDAVVCLGVLERVVTGERVGSRSLAEAVARVRPSLSGFWGRPESSFGKTPRIPGSSSTGRK